MDLIIRPLSGPQPTQPAPSARQGAAQPRANAQLPSESWVREQPATNFTIQLIAASSEAAVQDYIERHNLTDTAAYFRSLHRGSPWYSVVYGSFTNERQARTALQQLPPALTAASPWLRQYADIQ
jgi:septal ring-binding cell division protein DamX